MFGRLLTPLVTPLIGRFDLSPRPDASFKDNEELENASAENFARDVMIEVMRNAVESLKEADSLEDKIEAVSEIHRIMVEDACTKDVFRELDGYLLLVNALSTMHSLIELPTAHAQMEECERLVFILFAESLNEHPANNQHFEKYVGYHLLGEALCPLLVTSISADKVFGFLLSVALRNFALSNIFAVRRSQDCNTDFSDYKSIFGMLKIPGCYVLLVTLLPNLPPGDVYLPQAVFSLTETLISVNHRNKALLSGTRLFRTIFDQFLTASVPVVRLLKRLLDIGTDTDDVRHLFQHAIRKDGTLFPDVLDIIRSGMKAKWPMHFSMEGAASLQFRDINVKGLPSTGFTFMIWIYVERFSQATSQTIFKIEAKSRVLLELSLRSDGTLQLFSSENSEKAVLEEARIAKARWTHLVFVHHPHRASNPTIRIYVDGSLLETRHWAYPRTDPSVQTVLYVVGSTDSASLPAMSWCFASSYLLSLPLADDVPRIIQHLGPRYTAHFQTKDLYRFLTYEASTSLNVLLSSLVAHRISAARTQMTGGVPSGGSSTLRVLMDGIGIAEEAFLFSVFASGYRCHAGGDESDGGIATYACNGVSNVKTLASRSRIDVIGDVVPLIRESLDIALWKIGGAAVALRLVESASTSHELSRALSIFANSARASWQMSEDMERLEAYETLAHILRSKSQLINLTTFETLFEFLGINYRNPDRSVIVNSIAYRAIALDFSIWSSTKPDIQRMHFDHFSVLLEISRCRNFNAKQRMAKFGVVRKMLFVLQTNWYASDLAVDLVSAFKCVAQACFSSDDTIKPIVSFLAANLHEDGSEAPSPRSIVSHMDRIHSCNKAEEVLVAFVSILSTGNHFARLSSSLPVPRICLLLLGDAPSTIVAIQVLMIVGLAINSSSSFARKFELVSGWKAFKVALPSVWNDEVQRTVFDVLFGNFGGTSETQRNRSDLVVACPSIVPVILAALERGLLIVAQDSLDEEATIAESYVESLLEELMDLQSSSPTFRQVFKSQQTTAMLIIAYSAFVTKCCSVRANTRSYIRILEKMNHFVMALTLDHVVNSSQKHEIMTIFRQAETFLNSDSLNELPSPDATLGRRGSKSQAAHASVHILSERAYQKTMTKIRDWRKNIIANERKRFRRIAMDLREYCQRAERCNEWRNALYDDRGLWPAEASLRSWVLDESEGPCRVRKKLQRKFEVPSSLLVSNQTRAVMEPDNDAQSFVQVELVVPPWAEGYEFHAADEEQWVDEFSEDKLRRVRHEMENGDVIEAVCTVTRIVGVDSSPGLLLLGRSHLYMLDGLVENGDGEVVEACDAPRNLFTVPGSVLELDGKQRVQKWTYNQLVSFSRKTCLFRDVALEMYFKDNRSLLIVFPTKRRRQEVCDQLASSIATCTMPVSRSPLIFHRSPLLVRTAPKIMTGHRDEFATAQRKWQAREISNFTYISILNQTSGRTPCDATQYPVFPWVLADYSSETLDLTSPATFRDLSRPMGAITELRREAARQRYQNLKSVGEAPFHYGTHFSSSMIVCHFLIRLEPFTHMFKTLQGGDWDLPDRLFVDVARAYHSASQDVRGDVRELIPEFFMCPEFLQNLANVNFGVQQNTGEKIHDVKLPAWAKGDPLLFITEHRKALESDFVSENLHAWIDLIWGYKQRDPGSLNVFHPFSYEGSIVKTEYLASDLDKITDDLEREATVGIIHNFGQTPRKLFNSPHPPRVMQGPTTLPLGTAFGAVEDVHLLVQSPRSVAEISGPVASLAIDTISERVIPCSRMIACVPSVPHEQIAWGFVDQSIKFLIDRKVVQVVESVSCLCVAFVDADRFTTGSNDGIVRFWSIARRDGKISLSRTHMLRAHSAAILCVSTSRPWSCVVSGSEDGTAVIWDLNRAVYVRSIHHKTAEDGNDGNFKVHLVAINETTGYVASCSERKLCLHTINAYPIVELDLTVADPLDGRITSLAFHEREYARLGMLATGTESGSIVLRTWTASDTPAGEKSQWKFFTLRRLRCREGFDERRPKVTAVEFVGESLYHGDETGKVFSWDLPE